MFSARTAHLEPTITGVAATARPAVAAASRLAFIDNVRWVMILLVLSMHAAVTYSPLGSWYYYEHPKVGPLETLFFATYQGVLQGFFMALLFFVAGYFVPGSYAAKGPRGFMAGRLYRLGLPTLLFVAVLGPLTEYLANPPIQAHVLAALRAYVLEGQFISGTGPLWFCAALLIFCAAYAGWNAVRGARPARQAALPTAAGVALAVLGLALAAFLVRLVWPLGSSVLNMQLPYFPSYILMFTLGLVARRGDWLAKVTDRFAFTTAAICVGAAMLMWLPMLVLGGALRPGGINVFSGGLAWQSAGLCLWEALICIGMSFAVLAGFRRWLGGQGRLSKFMSDNAFAVYVIHPPILVALALLLHPVALEPVAKFLLLWALGAAVTFGIAAPLARRIPWVGRVLQ